MALALLVLLQTSLGLIGPLVGADWLASYVDRSRDISVSTSVGMILVCVALLAVRRPRTFARRMLGALLAACAVLMSAVLMGEDLVGSWMRGVPGGSVGPLGWIAPNAALTIILLGLAVLAIDLRSPRRWPLSELAAVTAGVIGFLGLLGYLYRVTELYWFARATAMSLPSCIAVIVTSAAVVFARSDRGLGALLASPGLGGQVARRLLPAAILIPTLLGLVRLAGERAHVYDTELGTALLIATTVVLFGGSTVWSAMALGRIDASRIAMVNELREESLALDLERRRLRAVLEVLPVAVVITDARGRVLDIGPEGVALWGEGAPTVTEKDEYARFRGWDAATGRAFGVDDWAIVRAFDRGETRVQEADIATFDGRCKTVLDCAAPIRDDRARVIGAVGVMVDITDRKRAERELAALKSELEERVRQRTAELSAANAELEAFSYSVSHDLRAPLRWIDGFAEALAEEHADDLGASGREYLRLLRESVQRMRELIDALLELSHVTTRPIERERVDVSAIARDIAREIESEDRSRRVEWSIAPDVAVDGDPRLLRILLDNLLRNAWKFSRERDTARIELGTTEDGAIFVRDNGVGFDPQYAGRLFRAFERLHPLDQFEGTGIGLALVRRIAVRHGGRVFAESHPGEGATFFVLLSPSSTDEGRA